MKKIIITLTLLSTMFIYIYASSFEEKFEWVKSTFIENDAGVPHILEKKGQLALDVHTQMIREKIKSVEKMDEFLQVTNEWLRFFRRYHYQLLSNLDLTSTNIEHEIISSHFTSYWDGDVTQFLEYATTVKDSTSYEGIWVIGSEYKIGIKKEDDSYIGFIIESVYEEWLPNMIKLRIDINDDDILSTFYLRNFSPELSGKPTMIGNNLIKMGRRIITRLEPIFPENPFTENFLKFLSANQPFFSQINKNTLYFRIPTFYFSDRENLMRVIDENIPKIKSTENLIIDLRNNPGGFSSYPLLDFLYTNPIKYLWEHEIFIGPINIQTFYDFSQGIHPLLELVDDEEREVMKQFGLELYEENKDKVGEFVRISLNEEGSTDVPIFDGMIIYNNTLKNPINIGIIVNKNTASAAEHYVILAKQSNKVKVFGEPTAGAVDTAFMGDQSGWAESPCGSIRLQYSEVRYSNVPDFLFDDIGIQPDFLIDSSVPEHKWVEHVNEIMQNWVTEPEEKKKSKRKDSRK